MLLQLLVTFTTEPASYHGSNYYWYAFFTRVFNTRQVRITMVGPLPGLVQLTLAANH